MPEAHVPTHRRTLSGRLVPLEQKRPDPWTRPDWTPQPSRAAYAAGFDQLTPGEHAALLRGDDDAEVPFFDAAADEMTRRPVDVRAAKRATRARKYRAAKRLVRAQRRALITERLTTPAPSGSALRKVERVVAAKVRAAFAEAQREAA